MKIHVKSDNMLDLRRIFIIKAENEKRKKKIIEGKREYYLMACIK